MTDPKTEARAIARFRIDWEHDDTVYPNLVRVWSDDGPFVSYDDHAAALAAKDAELAAVQVSNNKWLAKWERAEAALAEARKALGMMLKEHDILSGNFGDVMDPKHKRPDRWPTAAEAARRALTGGQGE